MNRVVLAAALGAVLVAAILVIGKLGLFHRPTSAQLQVPAPPMYGPAGAFPAPQAMSQSAVNALLQKWTYPGAKPVPIAAPRSTANQAWSVHLLRFTVYGQGIKVRRFYAARTGVKQNAGAGFSGSPFSGATEGYWHQIMNTVMVRSPEISESGEFSRNTRDYWVGAVYAIRPKRKQTLVEVLLIAYGGVQTPPSAASAPNSPMAPS